MFRFHSRSLTSVALLALLGCKGETSPEPSPEVNRFALTPFQSCDELQDHMTDLALESLVSARYSWGFGFRGDDVMEADGNGEEGPTDSDSTDDGGATSGPSDHTTTNIQELGVDEPDIVKTDGEWIYALQNGQLFIIHAWPAADAELVATLPMDGWPDSLFLHEDRLVAFSRGGGYFGGGFTDTPVSVDVEDVEVETGDWSDTGGEDEPVDTPDEPEEEEGESEGDGGDEPDTEAWFGAQVTVIDITDRTAPSVVRNVSSQGEIVAGRMIGSDLYLVQNSWFDMPWELYELLWDESLGLPEIDEDSTEAERETAAEQARQILRPLVEAAYADQEIQDALPAYIDGTAEAAPLLDCTDIYKPAEDSMPGLVSVVHMDIAQDQGDISATGVLSAGANTYASQDNLYVYMTSWSWGWGWSTDVVETHIHKFSLEGAVPSYEASGGVDGWTLNQFAMSEHEDILRVATTMPQLEEDWEPVSQVTTLEADGGVLSEVGSVGDIAPGEVIYAVRMIGEKGYVVTFEQTDPLFTVDLADPANPTVVGELEIPGYSGYLHPIDDGHLLAVGMDGDADGLNGGLAVSVFDVTDFANPTLAHKYTLGGDGWAWSEALYDHHAFTFSKGVLSIPATNYGWEDETDAFSGLLVLDIDLDSGITELGRVNHAELIPNADECTWWGGGWGGDTDVDVGEDSEDTTPPDPDPDTDSDDDGDEADSEEEGRYCWAPEVRRSIYMEDYLYSLSSYGVMVNELLSPDVSVAQVPFFDGTEGDEDED
jgi:hypothetical protein